MGGAQALVRLALGQTDKSGGIGMSQSVSSNGALVLFAACLFAVGLWVLAAFLFNDPACAVVDTLWWHPDWFRLVEKELLLLCRI